ncbi:hypothetical protein AW118_02955 [Escherichia coli]|nr:membrane protein [Escherichia coli]OTB65989.1 hypothetical protein AW065_07615 [Escherichia coli]OTC24367.1 hypothetical protein AW073_03125 [Escherichia coli]OTE61442.1 hypothetical protein AW118_02955 [Escherichia coli]
MSHFCITNKKKQKTSIFIFDQWIFWHIVIIVILVIIFILPGSHVITLFGGFICWILLFRQVLFSPAYWNVINIDQL